MTEVHVGEGSGIKVVSSAKAVRKVGGVAAGCAERQQANHIHVSSLLNSQAKMAVRHAFIPKMITISLMKHHFSEVAG